MPGSWVLAPAHAEAQSPSFLNAQKQHLAPSAVLSLSCRCGEVYVASGRRHIANVNVSIHGPAGGPLFTAGAVYKTRRSFIPITEAQLNTVLFTGLVF